MPRTTLSSLPFPGSFLRFIVPPIFLIITSACTTTTDKASSTLTLKMQQYYVHGEQLYTQHCSNCHQKNGKGLGRVYPPIDTSDYMDQNFESVVCLMKHGIKGEVTVNRQSFNKAMPGIPALSSLEITEIATYIYNTWSHHRDSIDTQMISRILDQCEQK